MAPQNCADAIYIANISLSLRGKNITPPTHSLFYPDFSRRNFCKELKKNQAVEKYL